MGDMNVTPNEASLLEALKDHTERYACAMQLGYARLEDEIGDLGRAINYTTERLAALGITVSPELIKTWELTGRRCARAGRKR